MNEIISRSRWEARHRAGFGARSVGALDKWLHHSVTPATSTSASFEEDAQAVRNLESIGQSRFGGGISYTFVVTPSGRIFEGHGISRIGAHTTARNTGSAGICLLGNYETSVPSEAMLDAVAWLLQYGVSAKWWKTRALNGGHRDVKGTACPGKHAYARIGEINAKAAGGAVTAPITGGAVPAPSGPRVLVYGHRGNDVKALQKSLGVTADGVFGPATLKALKAFQSSRGLTADGAAGPLTMAAFNTAAPSAPAPAPAPATPVRTPDGQLILAVDGLLGPATIARWQQVLGTPIDGVLSRPSTLIRQVQKRIGASPDGYLGPKTISALQRYLGTPVDGVISSPSTMVKELQTRLNRAQF